MKDAGTGEPVRRDTVFAACSNTKPVFAYAVVKLCEKGVMDLDLPLTKYTSRRVVEGDPRLDLILPPTAPRPRCPRRLATTRSS